MPRTLVVTNDFPPRIGGIESFVATVCELLDRDVVVYTSGPPGADATDRGRGYRVVRDGSLLLPTPATARQAARLLQEAEADRVVFGAAAPLGLLAPTLRAAGASRVVALTHGHEVWWATVPGARSLLRRIGAGCDHLTTISDYAAARIGGALDPAARARLVRLPPPVDLDFFTPDPRAHDDRPRCVAVARFVRQKGLDVLVEAWRQVLARPEVAALGPELVLVGDGPDRPRLADLVDRLGLPTSVRFTGALPAAGVRDELRRGSVFALPVRTRWAGLNPEGLGLAALEAAACGLPVLVGDSGGAPETVRPGRTGYVLDPYDSGAWADRLVGLLTHPEHAAALGRAGRELVRERYGTEAARATLAAALEG